MAPTEKPAEGFDLSVDDPQNPRVATIIMPIGVLAADKDFGTAVLRGLMEESKGKLIAIVNHIRAKQSQSGIIHQVPASPGLKVH